CDEREATEANKPGTPRRPRISRKPIAQGTPVVRLPCVACVRKMHFLCMQDPRVRPASGVPCALFLMRADDDAKLGRKSRRGNAEACSRHCKRSEAIHASARRDMDCFVAALLAMT